jgi:hypothetical protein
VSSQKSLLKDFGNQLAAFFAEPTVSKLKAAASLFPKWQYFAHTVAVAAVGLLLVVGLAVGFGYYGEQLRIDGKALTDDKALTDGGETGNGTPTDSAVTAPVQNNTVLISVLSVSAVVLLAIGAILIVKRGAIKETFCADNGSTGSAGKLSEPKKTGSLSGKKNAGSVENLNAVNVEQPDSETTTHHEKMGAIIKNDSSKVSTAEGEKEKDDADCVLCGKER